MLRGIYFSNTGLNAMQYRINTLADNVANVNTPGYKQEKTSFNTFKEALLTLNGKNIIGGISQGVKPNPTRTDFSMGNILETGRDYDFTIEGDGFFTLQTPTGFKYTRNGAFQVDADGYLVDANGNRVLGITGAIRMMNGKPDQKFRLVAFLNKDYLRRVGKGHFTASPRAGIMPAVNTRVRQGFLEASNTDMIDATTRLIESSKAYAFNSRVLMVQDRILEKTVNEVGKIK